MLIQILSIVLVAVTLIFMLSGLLRGPWAAALNLGAILLGALLMDEWAGPWGADVAQAFPLIDSRLARLTVGVALLVIPVVLIGYGGALLVPRLRPMRAWHRALGAMLGLTNGVALVAFAVRGWYYNNREFDLPAAQPLLDNPITRFYIEWAGWWPVVLTVVGSLAILIGLLTRRPAPAPVSPRPAPGVPAPASGIPMPGMPTPGMSTPAPGSLPPRSGPGDYPAPGLPRPEPIGVGAPLETRSVPALNDRPLAAPPSPMATSLPRPDQAPATNPAIPVAVAASAERRCRTCGNVLLPGAAFCTNCGTPVEA